MSDFWEFAARMKKETDNWPQWKRAAGGLPPVNHDLLAERAPQPPNDNRRPSMATELNPEKLAKLRELAAAATPGPWVADEECVVHPRPDIVLASWLTKEASVVVAECGGVAFDPPRPADASYIAAANPATVLALLDEIERLREALERIAKPTYGTELTDTDEERAKHYWTLLQVMQHIARKALDAAKEQA